METTHASSEIEVGWVSCANSSCRGTITDWSSESTISEAKIREQVGDPIRVMRSDGNLESGWRVFGSAVLPNEDHTWIVKVKLPQKHLSKVVALEDLQLWNS